jgi:hypothetical protein
LIEAGRVGPVARGPGVSSGSGDEGASVERGLVTGNEPEAVGPWLGYDEVFFDCDSTLTATEGIEELARLKGVEAAIAAGDGG